MHDCVKYFEIMHLLKLTSYIIMHHCPARPSCPSFMECKDQSRRSDMLVPLLLSIALDHLPQVPTRLSLVGALVSPHHRSWKEQGFPLGRRQKCPSLARTMKVHLRPEPGRACILRQSCRYLPTQCRMPMDGVTYNIFKEAPAGLLAILLSSPQTKTFETTYTSSPLDRHGFPSNCVFLVARNSAQSARI